MSVGVTGNLILLDIPFKLNDAARTVPGYRWLPTAKVWAWYATPQTARALEFALGSGLGERDDEFMRLLGEADSTSLSPFYSTWTNPSHHRDSVGSATDPVIRPFSLPPIYKTRPWYHQGQGYRMAMEQEATGLFFDMGCGKSKVPIDVMVNMPTFIRGLIVCPKSVMTVWPKEFDKHMGREILVCYPRSGTIAERAREASAALQAAENAGRPIVLIVNYESARRNEFAKLIQQLRWSVMVLDESHKIKAPRGHTSMFFRSVRRRAQKRICLTGTPMPHSPLDLWGQYAFLDPEIFGRSFCRFRDHFAVYLPGSDPRFKQVIGFQNKAELHARMNRIAMSVRKRDVLDLPPVLHEERRFALNEEAIKVYRQLERHLVAEVREGVVSAANALVKLLRLQQVTSGFVRTDDGADRPVDSGKADLLRSILEDLPAGDPGGSEFLTGPDDRPGKVAEREIREYAPCVVFARFLHDLDVIADVTATVPDVPTRYFELSGRDNQLEQWQAADLTRRNVLGIQIQAGGLGIDLTKACYAVYYSLGFSMGDYEQSLARLDRPGQTRPVTYFHLLAEGTIDDRVFTAFAKRKDAIEEILKGFQKCETDLEGTNRLPMDPVGKVSDLPAAPGVIQRLPVEI